MTNDRPRVWIGDGRVELAGPWTLAELMPDIPEIRQSLAQAVEAGGVWDLSAVSRMDSAAAALLWRAWGRRWPAEVVIANKLRHIVDRLAGVSAAPAVGADKPAAPLEYVGRFILLVWHHVHGLVTLFGQLVLDVIYLLRHRREVPWREFSANVFKAGAQALPVSALVGFLIGVTISYLSALQLKMFGADLFIVNILGISIIRELGPVLVAVLVAGRSGSAMTAQIGVMRVTEEIDALSTLGISSSIRIVLPKVAALTVVMPLLVLWTSAVALVGGMVAAHLQLDLSPLYFVNQLPRAVPVANLVIGLCKGVAFGLIIALIACYFGLRVRPNTESLSAHTTAAVVSAITSVIILDAIFAVLTRQMGMPTL